jgi:hypothetical protein
MWRLDPLKEFQHKLEVSHILHREAGKRGFSCSPKRSSIDGSYFAEINEYVGNGFMKFNVKMGTGPTPLEAAVDGYRKAVPLDDMMAVLYLEVEAHLLSEIVRVTRSLEVALEGLETALVDTGRRFLWDDA